MSLHHVVEGKENEDEDEDEGGVVSQQLLAQRVVALVAR